MEDVKNKSPKEYKPGDVYEVPPEGSLGLLALGYKGLEAWREAKKKAIKEGENTELVKPNDSTEL